MREFFIAVVLALLWFLFCRPPEGLFGAAPSYGDLFGAERNVPYVTPVWVPPVEQAVEPLLDYDSLLPKDRLDEQRYVALMRWNSLRWFAEGCRLDTLPKVHTLVGVKPVPEKGQVVSQAWLFQPFPLDQYTEASDYLYLSHDTLTLGFGLYCLEVSESVTVRIECVKYCREGDRAARELSPGRHVMLIHATEGLARGWWRVEMRCTNGTSTCDVGGLTATYFSPFYRLKDLLRR